MSINSYQKFYDFLNGGFTLIWVVTTEDSRAEEELRERSRVDLHWFSWDIDRGFVNLSDNSGRAEEMDPLGPIKKMESLPEKSVVFLKDFHLYIKSPEVFRALKNLRALCETTEKRFVVLSPVDEIPCEIENDFVVWDFPLPNRNDLIGAAKKLAEENGVPEIDVEAAASAVGMGLQSAVNAFSMSLVTNKGRLDRDMIEEQKKENIRRIEGLEWWARVGIDQVGGLDSLKNYLKSRKRGFELDTKLPTPKGILLVGLPGAGKSLSAKMAASIFGVPLIRFDLGSMKASLVGETERRTRKALQVIDANSPLVVWIDEIEKSLGGVMSSSRSDAGTTSNMFSTLLTWMQESNKPHFIVATCNEIGEILQISQGALLRRFDDIFFVDVPSVAERKEILKIMNKRYGTDVPEKEVEEMGNWTGAEIERFCRDLLFTDDSKKMADRIAEAKANIRLIYNQNQSIIEELRSWTKSNARRANATPPDTEGGKKKTKRSLSLGNLSQTKDE